MTTNESPGQRRLMKRSMVPLISSWQHDIQRSVAAVTADQDNQLNKLVDDFVSGSQATAGLVGKNKKEECSNHHLMSSMLSRIAALDKHVEKLTKDVAQRDKQIRSLQRHLNASVGTTDSCLNCHRLEKEMLHLSKTVDQMDQFLADYGMIWVGDDDADSKTVESTWCQEKSLGGYENKIDFDKLLVNLEELNFLSGAGQSIVCRTGDGASLRPVESVSLSFYSNGIVMFEGPFRPYTDPSTQRCIKDLTDGYFPSELQSRYPDGVPFDVKDYREIEYHPPTEKFSGAGQALGGKGDHNTRKFLEKLPESIVRNGRVVSVREDLSEALGVRPVNTNRVTLLETEIVQEMRTALDANQRPTTASSRQTVTIRVKSETGDETYLVKLKEDNTVNQLYQTLVSHRNELKDMDFMLKSGLGKTITRAEISLREAGLAPNATLHLKLE